jgi:hydroxyacylglutathione hydrolase
MLFTRFYDTKLAQASYLVGCQATGECIVVDPTRDVEPYVRAAEAEGMRVTHVTETHVHADFVSGARELATRTGAQLLLSAEGGDDWQYAYAAGDGARLLRDGDVVMVGNVELRALHTPGHTPEHLAFVVTDTPAASGPMGVLTGDCVFVGDVGRPDLLERAAGQANTMEASARALHRSIERLAALPDHLQLWPGHGAGSACGRALGAVPSSTLGYERQANWAFAPMSEDDFVRRVLDGQPEAPAYFAQMKRINRDGPRVLGGFARPPHLAADALDVVLRDATVLDTRPAAAFADGHVPGTVNIPLEKSFTSWSGWLVPYDRPAYLLVDESRVDEAVRDLAMIGLDQVAGWFSPDAVAGWAEHAAARGAGLQRVPQMTVQALQEHIDIGALARGEIVVLDVRGQAEWEAGHLPGVPNAPLGYLRERVAELPYDRPIVLHCQGGGRSAIGASVLQSLGFTSVTNVTGGYGAWVKAGGAVER